ncbi:F-box domain-containing protein [Mycena venus]|uniref:F-box domain-containing protein n=1 Tax=Mycena venus TaxID=2733690 RepID=A0A8H7D634_9AGAR|nr:F-box domain-containing protein [Mycena venus]
MNTAEIPDEKPTIHKKATLTLNEFPMDTLIHIQSFMDPMDILALRQCSKMLVSATLHRTVWLNALRRVCAAHEVSLLTYPMENMSLAELQHAATSPARFIAQISKDRTTDDPNSGVLYASFPTSVTQVSRRRLISNPYPLVSIVLPISPSQLLVQPTKDHNGFRILTLCPSIMNNMVDVTVYEIYPAADQPTFKQIANHRIFSSSVKVYALTADRFTYYCNFLLTTWDFVENASATVHVYQLLMSITVSRTAVIGQHEDGIVVVEIPPLHPTGTPAAEVVVEPISPLPMFSHVHDAFADFADLYTMQADWYTSPDIPLVLDIFGRLVDGWNAYARCVVKKVPGGDPDLPSALPVLMGISRVPPETFDAEFYGRLHSAGTHLMRTWPTDTSVMINAATIPTRRQIEFESKTGLLWSLPRETDQFMYDLDPTTGRFIAWTAPTEIRVLDFLLPKV